METPQTDPTESSDEAASTVLRRIRRNAAAAYVVFAVFSLFYGGFMAFAGLTCSAAVTIISFLWLEEIVEAILQPSPQLNPRKLTLRALGRFALLGLALSVAILVVHFDTLSVLLGFSIVVVGIMGEAVYATYRSFAG